MYQIAIDGPAGSGKSTVAKKLAKQINFDYIDTGAMYRSIAYKALELGIDFENDDYKFIDNLNLRFDGNKVILDNIDISSDIRTPQVSNCVYLVAKNSYVRKNMTQLQVKTAFNRNVIMDGRDIGTNVLPNANLKFFLIADPDVRANRRHIENIENGLDSNFEEIRDEILKRDHIDKTRDINPLVMADDAILIDTSYLSIEEVINTIKERVRS